MNRNIRIGAVAFLAAFALALPSIAALLCDRTVLDAGFLVAQNRPLCKGGTVASLLLQALLLAVLLWKRPNWRGWTQGGAGAFFAVAGILVFGLYIFLFTLSADRAMFSADQDVTNVSTAIAHTSLNDILPSPYVAAGASRSFLAHHFSPSLLLFVPFYRVAMLFSDSVNHNFYIIMLFVTLLAGMLLWCYYAYRSLPSLRWLLPVAMIPILHSFLLYRQILSFHFEVLSLPLMALLLLSLRLQDRQDIPGRAVWLKKSWPLIALLYAGIKEDMGVYLGLFAGVYFLFECIDEYRKKGDLSVIFDRIRRSVYFRLGLLAVSWTVIAMVGRLWMAGDGAPDWQSYWDVQEFARRYPSFRKTPYTYVWALLSSGIWVFFSWRGTVLVLLILSLHMVSGMPWHALLESHYSYTLLPFLFAGSIRGLSHIADRYEKGRWSAPLVLSLVFGGGMVADYSLLRDGNHPYSLFAKHPLYHEVDRMVKLIPDGACVQSSFHLSALVPLRARPIPFSFYRGSPFEKSMPAGALLHLYDRENGECPELYRLFYGSLAGELQAEMQREGTVIAGQNGRVLLWRWDPARSSNEGQVTD